MNTFKVGDKVKVNGGGAVGTVTSTNADEDFPIEVRFTGAAYDLTDVFAVADVAHA